MEGKNNDKIIEEIIKELFIDIDSSKKFTFDFKSSFLNNNFNNPIGVIAIKRHILLKFLDSFEQTIKNIEQKLILLQKNINDNKKNINNHLNNKTKSEDNMNCENKADGQINELHFQNDLSLYDLDKNKHLINRIKKRNKINHVNHNDYFKKNYSLNSGSYKNEFFHNQINYINNMNNYNYKINNNMSLKSNDNKDNIKNYLDYGNYTLKNPEIISKKFYNFNDTNNTFNNINSLSDYSNNKVISNSSFQKGHNSVIKVDNNFINYKDNCQFLNEREINNEDSYNNSLPKNINPNIFSIYLNKKNSFKMDENENYFNIEETSSINNGPEIKIKSPIREIIKKIIKNKNKINESFLNYSTISGNKHIKSFNFNKKTDSIISKIKNSENLILYFSEKYGNGDFNVFLNEYERNKISKELIKREINNLEKSIKKNNKNTGNSLNGLNDKNIIENTNQFVKKRKITPYKKDKKNLNLKNKTIEQIKKNQKIYRTLTPTSRENDKVINQRNNNNFLNKKNNISNSFGRSHLKDLKDEKKYNKIEVNPQDFPFGNKNKSYYNNNNHKRYKTPFNNYNNLNGILF